MYHLFEIAEDVIVGVPIIEMGQDIFEQRIMPSIRASRYAQYIPRTGGGSRGGKATTIAFGNGATVRFMGAGGGDQQRSGHGARVVVLTEIDKMDSAGRASKEADPVTQFEQRTSSHGSAAIVYGECTMSTETGRIYREVHEYGTDSRPAFRCPHCLRFVELERSCLRGWQDAKDIIEARARAVIVCPNCSKAWSENDRAVALLSPMAISRGQEIDERGVLVGPEPTTDTFGFRWTCLAASLRSMADIAAREFKAAQTATPEAEKGVKQFEWAEPWTRDRTDLSGLTRKSIFAKIVGHDRGVIPPEAIKVTMGVDIGKYLCWWTLMSWTADGQGHVVDYGMIQVGKGAESQPSAILSALRSFRADVVNPGWEGARRPDLTLVDSGYADSQEVVYKFVTEVGQRGWLASKGFGTGFRQIAWRSPGASKVSGSEAAGGNWIISVQPNGIRLLEFYSDHWKTAIHEGFGAPGGVPGSITLYKAPPIDHLDFAGQVMAERRLEDYVEGKGIVVYWESRQKDNHYLDCLALARCAADMLGIRALVGKRAATPAPGPVVKRAPPRASGGGLNWRRNRY
jgi:phage terminase large subunit GpA-like protein